MNRIVVLCALILAASATAQAPPIDFKGVPFGATAAQILKTLPKSNFGSWCRAKLHDGTCALYGVTFANQYAEGIDIAFKSGGLYSVTVRVDASTFDRVLQAITEKYGKPGHLETPELQNAVGAKFQGVRATWEDGTGATINAYKHLGRIDSNLFLISSPARNKAVRDYLAKQPPPKKDI